jgi:transcriptional regulator with XRE-family HTH domain
MSKPITADVERAIQTEEETLRQRLRLKVKALRTASGLTLKAAGEQSRTHWRHWQKLEAGEVNVTIGTLVRIARVLRVDVTDLFGKAEKVEAGATRATRAGQT